MKAFLKRIGDMFLDQQGGVDDKRVMGVLMLLYACVYIGLIKVGDVAGFSAIALVGGGLLGVAAPTATRESLAECKENRDGHPPGSRDLRPFPAASTSDSAYGRRMTLEL